MTKAAEQGKEGEREMFYSQAAGEHDSILSFPSPTLLTFSPFFTEKSFCCAWRRRRGRRQRWLVCCCSAERKRVAKVVIMTRAKRGSEKKLETTIKYLTASWLLFPSCGPSVPLFCSSSNWRERARLLYCRGNYIRRGEGRESLYFSKVGRGK